MQLTAGQVAELVGGELVGRADVGLAGAATLEAAGPGELSFLASSRYLNSFHRSNAGAVLITPGFRDVVPGPATRIVVSDPYGAMGRVLRAWQGATPTFGVDPTAVVGRVAKWTGRLSLGAGAVLGKDVTLGEGCVIGPRATVGDGVILGDGCRIE